MNDRRALAGIGVLDLCGTVATAYYGKLFAEHGADVIDVEPPRGARVVLDASVRDARVSLADLESVAPGVVYSQITWLGQTGALRRFRRHRRHLSLRRVCASTASPRRSRWGFTRVVMVGSASPR